MLPKTFSEHELHGLFQAFGELKEVHIIRGPEGSPKGCAFVKFVDREAANSAINQLNETIPPVSLICRILTVQQPCLTSPNLLDRAPLVL
jgi:RNA recognition motif-containing protein